ncbi:MAG: type 2 isopentenyl-diphosphate Delta-isomerase [bacterium]
MSHEPDISSRKVDHIELCARQEVESRARTTLLEEVELLHDALPEVDFEEVDLSLSVFDRVLQAPLLITGMTGGASQAHQINTNLARVAQRFGLAFGVGSQRAILRDRALAKTYQVRDVAPDVLLLGNIGGVQAAQMSSAEAQDLVDIIGADALCVHLNPGQELIQPEGDRDFRGIVNALARLTEELQVPVIAKETGCGLSPRALHRLRQANVRWVDTSGSGGTTWIGVETLRTPPEKRTVGEMFWDWGIPTAPSIIWARELGFNVIGSGGVRNGLDCARVVALGAKLAGMALPWLRAAHDEGEAGAAEFAQATLQALKTTCVLTGSRNIEELQTAPRIFGPNLERWARIKA